MKKLIGIVFLIFITSFSYSQQKYAIVDSEYILENIPEYLAAQDKLDEYSIEWQEEIEAKFKEIDSLYKTFQTESVLLPEDVKLKKEEEIHQTLIS